MVEDNTIYRIKDIWDNWWVGIFSREDNGFRLLYSPKIPYSSSSGILYNPKIIQKLMQFDEKTGFVTYFNDTCLEIYNRG